MIWECERLREKTKVIIESDAYMIFMSEWFESMRDCEKETWKTYVDLGVVGKDCEDRLDDVDTSDTDLDSANGGDNDFNVRGSCIFSSSLELYL